jgi:hypothetical protein
MFLQLQDTNSTNQTKELLHDYDNRDHDDMTIDGCLASPPADAADRMRRRRATLF